MSLSSPFKDKLTGDMPKTIHGKREGPELDSYKHDASVPVGESVMGSPEGAKSGIDTPFDQRIPPAVPRSIRGRKNP